ncbi:MULTISPECIES: DUF1622 domain-containing protein [Williamsia]|uniref:Uncharacterized protein DUF1622 n=1 Tax=Williamsia marianensis TaxID=85044 RepID=A0A495ISQ0_WILMA|nr:MULTISPECIES: DUF1622 domain-containing protein [Williamsia]PZT95345.1 MAG: DUF1622 domain-containing protein [Gordonia sp. (in: high G+C Gram-positive bacteria)]RKR79787.1 uncharacterized protein DUF1622 [Williamsia muralis]
MVLAQVALIIAAAGVVLAAAVLVRTRQLTVALPILLDLLLAAGVLRLSAAAPWQAIMVTAVVVVLRKAASWSLRRIADQDLSAVG